MTGIIVLDGPDCCGKTTLAKTLITKYGAKYVHATYRFGNTMFAYHTAVLRKAVKLSASHLVVVDRLWPSEVVYGNVFRKGLAYGKEPSTESPWSHGWSMFDAVLRKHAAIYVFCLPNDVTVASARHAKHKDPAHPYEDERYKEVCNRYLQLHSFLSSTVDRPDIMAYRIEREGADVADFAQQVVIKLAYWRAQQWMPLLRSDFPNVLGHVALAKAMFVGDQLNSYTLKLRWPFFFYGNSSLHLHRAMQDAFGAKQAHIMLANANDPGTITEIAVINKKYRIPVYALGKAAELTLTVNKIPLAGAFVHPQWSKRFRPDLLVNEFRNAEPLIMKNFRDDLFD